MTQITITHFIEDFQKPSQNYGQLGEGRDLEGGEAEETGSVTRGQKKGWLDLISNVM